MKKEDIFDTRINWIKMLNGKKKEQAGSIVAWQFVVDTLQVLVQSFSSITGDDDKRRIRESQIKKMLIGMLFEMDECLDLWANQLRINGLLDDEIKRLKKKFKQSSRKVSDLKDIRNGIAFHFADSLLVPDAIIELYTRVDKISLDTINEIMTGGILCGESMKIKFGINLSES